jgi:hypothetical protein
MPVLRCECGCKRVFTARARRQFFDMAHYRQSPQYRAQVVRASHVAKAARDLKRGCMALKGFGPLTPRELALYERGRHNGWSSGYDMGRRKGWADATDERAVRIRAMRVAS